VVQPGDQRIDAELTAPAEPLAQVPAVPSRVLGPNRSSHAVIGYPTVLSRSGTSAGGAGTTALSGPRRTSSPFATTAT
jgi:hypothetical protein